MPDNDYHLVSHWRVVGTAAEVADVLADPIGLARWWGSVYREVEQIEPGDARGLGNVFRVRAKGWLPYALRLEFRQTEQHYPTGFTVAVRGDLEGIGIWTFAQDGPEVDITFDWTVRAEKAIVRRFSSVLKPVFASNHNWTMRRGEQSLRIELARRRAQSPEERALLADPPGPFAARPLLLVLTTMACVSAVLAAGGALRRARRCGGRGPAGPA
jgi:hypothetical protein